MTAVVPDTEQLRELAADTRQAWSAYSTGLRGPAGDEYERAESESWTEPARTPPAFIDPSFGLMSN